MTRFIVRYTLFSGLIALIAILIPFLFPAYQLLAPEFWIIYTFIVLITLIAYIVAYKGTQKAEGAGVLVIMVAFIVKLLAAAIFVLIYSHKQPSLNLQFIFNFFILYLLFSVFEILGLLRNLRHQNLK